MRQQVQNAHQVRLCCTSECKHILLKHAGRLVCVVRVYLKCHKRGPIRFFRERFPKATSTLSRYCNGNDTSFWEDNVVHPRERKHATPEIHTTWQPAGLRSLISQRRNQATKRCPQKASRSVCCVSAVPRSFWIITLNELHAGTTKLEECQSTNLLHLEPNFFTKTSLARSTAIFAENRT